MKPPKFDYVAPTTVAEAVDALARHNGDARPLSGGQSLVPMLNFRLATPSMLVDLCRIGELSGISISASEVSVGATTRTARLLDKAIEESFPVLTAAARLVAHPQIRNRGTVGGSIANADPAAELPAVAVLTGARIRLAGPSGERAVLAEEFFKGTFTTACEWNEIVVGINFPRPRSHIGWGFREFARRPGDFAVAGAGVLLSLTDSQLSTATIVVFGVGPLPMRVPSAEQALLRRPLSESIVREARTAFEADINVDGDAFGSAQYKRRIAGVVFERAVEDALAWSPRNRRTGPEANG